MEIATTSVILLASERVEAFKSRLETLLESITRCPVCLNPIEVVCQQVDSIYDVADDSVQWIFRILFVLQAYVIFGLEDLMERTINSI